MLKTCQKCKKEVDDTRTLWMACSYEMNELELPFIKIKGKIRKYKVCYPHLYTLVVCKDCRTSWMQSIKDWFYEPIEEEFCKEMISVAQNLDLAYNKGIKITETDTLKKNID